MTVSNNASITAHQNISFPETKGLLITFAHNISSPLNQSFHNYVQSGAVFRSYTFYVTLPSSEENSEKIMRCTEVLIDNLTNNFSKITQTVPSGLTLYMQASQSRVIGEPAIVREGDDGATANYITSVIEIILPIFIDY